MLTKEDGFKCALKLQSTCKNEIFLSLRSDRTPLQHAGTSLTQAEVGIVKESKLFIFISNQAGVFFFVYRVCHNNHNYSTTSRMAAMTRGGE